MTATLLTADRQPGPSSERDLRVDRLNDEAWTLLHKEPERSRSLADEAYALATETEPIYTLGAADSLLVQSILEWDRSEYKPALTHALKALAWFEAGEARCKQAYTLNHIAGIHYFLGNASSALEAGAVALQLVEDCGNTELLASILNDTSYMMLHLGSPQNALEQLQRSLEMHRELGALHGEAQALDSIGKAYLLLGDTQKALEYAQQSLELDQRIGYHRAEAEVLGNIGKIHIAAGDLDQAQDYFERSLALSRARGYRQFEAEALLDIGRVALRRGAAEQALAVLRDAVAVAQEIEATPLEAEIHVALSDAYEQVGDLAQCLAHYKRYHNLREAAVNELADLRISSLQATHEADTARQQAEIYRLKNVALQQEIEEREQLIAELDAFARTVAHDLKNPLWVITGLGELIQEFLVSTGNEEMIMLGQNQQRMAQKMSSIIDELLLLAQVRREDVALERLDMGAIVDEVLARLHQQLTEAGAELHIPDTWPTVLGYAQWVEELWANYLSNAIKYGGQPPRIELGARQEGDAVRFWVRDNGPGIPEDEQGNLFTEFARLTSLSNDQQGHGLGLSIVRRIAEKLGGSVGFENAPGGGGIFSFTLPAAEAVQGQEDAAP